MAEVQLQPRQGGPTPQHQDLDDDNGVDSDRSKRRSKRQREHSYVPATYAQSPSRCTTKLAPWQTSASDSAGMSADDLAIEVERVRAVRASQMQQLAQFRTEQGDELLLTLGTKELNEVLKAGDYTDAQVLEFKTAR